RRTQPTRCAVPRPPAGAKGIEAGGPLWESRHKRRLRWRQQRRGTSKVGAAGPFHTDDLISIRGEIQIERENLTLGESMLETHREDGFVELASYSSMPPW